MGDSLRLGNDALLNCEIHFEDVVTIRGDSSRGWPSPGDAAARDSKGRFYTSIVDNNSSIAVWSSSGEFIRTIGRPGEGPGEIPTGSVPPILLVDSRDFLHVRTMGFVYTLFDSLHEFSARQRVTAGGEAVMAGGVLLTGTRLRGSPHQFTVSDATGTLRAFGELPPGALSTPNATARRAISGVNDSLFWAGPMNGYAQGYTLELWSLSGTRRGVLQRDASWYSEARDPGVQPKNIDADGGILVFTWQRNDNWRVITDRELQRELVGTMQDIYIELIDPDAGVVLGTKVIPLTAIINGSAPSSFFRGTRLGYRSVEDSLGFRTIHVVRYALKTR
jgi:hypothetical protein